MLYATPPRHGKVKFTTEQYMKWKQPAKVMGEFPTKVTENTATWYVKPAIKRPKIPHFNGSYIQCFPHKHCKCGSHLDMMTYTDGLTCASCHYEEAWCDCKQQRMSDDIMTLWLHAMFSST